MTQTSIDWEKLRAIAKSEFKLPLHSQHGPAHWESVKRIGFELAAQNGADETVIALFALFHGVRRRKLLEDFRCGTRACDFMRQIRGRGVDVSDEQFDTLLNALGYHLELMTARGLPPHAGATQSQIVTIGTCLDADRLDHFGHRLPDRVVSTPQGMAMLRSFQKPSSPRPLEIFSDDERRSMRRENRNTPDLPRFLYHGTSSRWLEQIRANGLQPRAQSKNDVEKRPVKTEWMKTHPEMVYLSCKVSSGGPIAHAIMRKEFDEAACKSTKFEMLILQVDTEKLNTDGFFPDQDWMDVPAEIESRRDLWMDCLTTGKAHSCTHQGTIPPSAISSYLVADRGDYELETHLHLRNYRPDLKAHSEVMDEMFARRGQPFAAEVPEAEARPAA